MLSLICFLCSLVAAFELGRFLRWIYDEVNDDG
jgi:hypothetical protein